MLQLHEVRHIPGLRKNLLSIGQLDVEGYAVTFNCSGWKITQGAMITAQGKNEDTLYTTTGIEDCVTIAGAKCDADLWHDRRGYTSE